MENSLNFSRFWEIHINWKLLKIFSTEKRKQNGMYAHGMHESVSECTTDINYLKTEA